jgi:hypothetical protein
MNLAAHKWIGPLPCSRGGLDGSAKLTMLELWSAGTWTLEASQRVSTTREQLAAGTGQSLDVIKDHLRRLALLGWIRRTAAGWELAWATPFETSPGVQVAGSTVQTPGSIGEPGGSSRREPGGSSRRVDGSNPRAGGSSRRPSNQVLSSVPSGETSTGPERDPVTLPEPLTLTPIEPVGAKPDPVGESIDRILAAQSEAIDAAIAVHGASPRCRLPGQGTKDRRVIEALIRDRLVKDNRSEADCLHVVAAYRRSWIEDSIALRNGWTTETPWRAKNFNARLRSDPGVSSCRASGASKPRRFVDSAVYTGPPLGLPPLLNEPEPPRVEVETDW